MGSVKNIFFYIWFINYLPSGGRPPGFGLTMATATVLQRVNNLTYLFSSIKPRNQYRNNMPGKQSANINCKQISQLIEPAQIMKIKFRQFLIIHFFSLLVSKSLHSVHTELQMCYCLELEEHRFWCNFYLFLLIWNLNMKSFGLWCTSHSLVQFKMLGCSQGACPCKLELEQDSCSLSPSRLSTQGRFQAAVWRSWGQDFQDPGNLPLILIPLQPGKICSLPTEINSLFPESLFGTRINCCSLQTTHLTTNNKKNIGTFY